MKKEHRWKKSEPDLTQGSIHSRVFICPDCGTRYRGSSHPTTAKYVQGNVSKTGRISYYEVGIHVPYKVDVNEFRDCGFMTVRHITDE